jgi:hypothetical protein
MDNSHTNEDLIYFGTAATVTGTCRVFKSDDSGFSLTDITNGLPNRYPRDIAVDPLNDQRVYVVFSGFGTGHIFSSANGGQSWTDISTALPDVPFHTILIDPANSNFLYAGSDLGVFFSSNAGQSWSAMNTGLPESGFIFDLKYSADNNNLVAFTHGRGAYTIPLDNLNVGIARQLSEKKIAIYPTVFDDFIIIENTDDGKAGDFLLFDMKGSLVFSARTTGDRMQKISLPAGLHSGVYIAKAGGQATRLCKK